MLSVSRDLRFKNMDIFTVKNLMDYYGLKFETEEELEEYQKNGRKINILIMDLRRPIDFKVDTELPYDEDLEGANFIKVLVLSSFELDEEIKGDIEYFCENMRGSLDFWFSIEFKKYDDFTNFEISKDNDESYLEWKKSEYLYFKKNWRALWCTV